jgi:hypothetical protein
VPSAIDICNLALSHLGDEANVIAITPPDGTMQAAHCGRFYPIARDAVLASFDWSFATKRALVAQLATNPAAADWAYAYTLPSDCLRPLSALYPGVPAVDFGTLQTDGGSFPYLMESADDGSRVMYTNVPTATLRYIGTVTDTTFPPLVVLAIARLLASFLAGPILKGDTGIKASEGELAIFKQELAAACIADARLGHRDISNYRPAWIVARNYATNVIVDDPRLRTAYPGF